jgi:hypothetical protein
MRALILIVAVACASANGNSYGSVTLKSAANYAARPQTFSVGKGHVSGNDLNVYLDGNCIRGAEGRIPIDFCRVDDGSGAVQRWSGASGDFTVRPEGEMVVADGYWNLDTGRTISMRQDFRIGEGPAWQELKKNPALLAVVSTAGDVQAAHLRR